MSKLCLVKKLLKLSSIENFVCKSCIQRKWTRELFKTKEYISSSKPLDLIHLDLLGLTKIQAYEENIILLLLLMIILNLLGSSSYLKKMKYFITLLSLQR